MLLKQSTTVTKKLGPFVDSGDAVTLENGLTIQKADVKLSKNDGAYAAANADQGASDVGAAYDANGDYGISLNTTDTGTLGPLRVSIIKAGALPVWAEFLVVPANVYDALVSGLDKLQVDAQEIEGVDATSQLATEAAIGAAAALLAYDAPTQTDLDAAQTAIIAVLTAIKGGGWTTETLKDIRDQVALRLLTSGYTAPPSAAAVASQVDTTLSGSHGAGQWGASASGEFSYTVTVRRSDTLALLRDALVTIRASNGTTIRDQKRTNDLGVAVFALDAASYFRTVSALGYSSAGPTSFTVAANGTVTVDLTPLTVSPPSSDEFVTLYGDLYLDATAQEDAVVTASIADEDLPAVLGDYGLNSGADREGTANGSGRWEIELQRGVRYRITSAAYGLRDQPVTMPTDVDEVSLVSLLT